MTEIVVRYPLPWQSKISRITFPICRYKTATRKL